MEKRILVAFVLSLLVWYGYSFLVKPKDVPVPESASTSSPAPAATPAAAPSPAPPAPPQPVAKSAGKSAQAAAVSAPVNEDVHADAAAELVVETKLAVVTVSNHGGVLRSFKLKGYTDAEGLPIELIDATGAAKLGWPLALVTMDAKLDDAVSSANFVMKRDGDRVLLDYAANGIRVHKELAFEQEGYEFSVAASLERDGKSVPHSIAWQGGFGDQSIPPDPVKRQVVVPDGGSYKRETLAALKVPEDKMVGRIGIEDQFFLAMFLLPGDASAVKIKKAEYTGADGKVVGTIAVAAAAGDQPIRVYVGPKDRKADVLLGGIIDYGTYFGFIAKPLMLALLFVHSYIGNFGWSIILLTAFIGFVLFPLRLKQQVSMQKMQKIQPQMRTLQDKYKKLKATDPRRAEVQAQMMNVYKEHGINPMSGCLPLLLQMPFLYAFWTMLRVSIELRQAPWIFWIKDLSLYDHYYVLPILMAVSMLITQKLTPANMDPAQARMMMIMPVMFTAIFLWAQSGLVLYYLTSNVIGIGQQFFINKYWVPRQESAAKDRYQKKPQIVE